MDKNCKEWFSDWFDSPYYHILYKNRDLEEAEKFIRKLAAFLHFTPGEKALDVACGRGRHAVYLHKLGLEVDGIDLSCHNIEFAKQYVEKGLQFYVHDMREIFREGNYNYIFNLFTSFGYFENETDNYKTIESFAKGLVSGGSLVIDFLNPEKVVNTLVPEEQVTQEGIRFNIRRKVEGNFILKEISFSHDRTDFVFIEKVSMLKQEDFLKYFNFAGLSIVAVFGNYDLEEYAAPHSDRMIFIVRKN